MRDSLSAKARFFWARRMERETVDGAEGAEEEAASGVAESFAASLRCFFDVR